MIKPLQKLGYQDFNMFEFYLKRSCIFACTIRYNGYYCECHYKLSQFYEIYENITERDFLCRNFYKSENIQTMRLSKNYKSFFIGLDEKPELLAYAYFDLKTKTWSGKYEKEIFDLQFKTADTIKRCPGKKNL